jgi:hypothetical protein
MLEAKNLAEELAKHVASCPSGIMVCNVGAAVEGWFKVELAQLLAKAAVDSVNFCYDYPNTREKADLAAKGSWGLSIVEIKCFVQGADSQKMKDWPLQPKRLLNLVQNDVVAQGVAASTYFGYSEKRISGFLSRFYPAPWSYWGPVPFIVDAPLQLVMATASNPSHGHAA